MQSRLTLEHLESNVPGALSLYLGQTRGISSIENVPDAIEEVYLAEDLLDPSDRGKQRSSWGSSRSDRLAL
jgi:hypothetical protein